jgi:biotin transport system substrate-specific component
MKDNFYYLIITPLAILFIAISAQLSISLPKDISTVPITGQTFSVLIIAHLLKHKWASLVTALYILVGILGAPVFSEFSSGIDSLSGPSGGYLIGFVAAAFITGKISSLQEPNFKNLLIQMGLGTLVILLIGYLGLFRFLNPADAFTKGVKPYLLGAFVKIFLSVILLTIFYKLKALMNNKVD